MALVKCKECGADISSGATACPHCGNPINPTSSVQKAKAHFRSGAATGLIGGGFFVLFMVILYSGGMSSSDTSSEGISVTIGTATNALIGLSGFIFTALAVIPLIAALIFAGKMKRKNAIMLSAVTLVISSLGLLGMVAFYGLIAICGGWLFIWEPLLEVFGSVKMLKAAMMYES